MAELNVTAKDPKSGREITVPYDFDALLEDRELTNNAAKRSWVIALQGYIRLMLKKGKPDEEVKQKAAEWKPGIRAIGAGRKSAKEKYLDEVAGMDEAAMNEEIKKLKAEIAARRKAAAK